MTEPSGPAVTFDLWHTLIYVAPEDEERYMQRQVEIAVESMEEAPRTGPAGTPGAPGALFEAEYHRAVAEAEQGRSVPPVEQYRRAARAAGRDPDPTRYLARLEALAGGLPFRRAPAALEALAALAEEGYALAIISNTVGEPGACLRPALRRLGFEASVREFVFSDEQPWTKPAPEIFRWTLERLGRRPSEAIHVGDGWADVEGARRAGYRAGIRYVGLPDYGARYRALFAPGPGRTPPAGWEVDRLDDVPTLIARIRAGATPPAP